MLSLSLLPCHRYNSAELRKCVSHLSLSYSVFDQPPQSRRSEAKLDEANMRSLMLRPGNSLTVQMTALSVSFNTLISRRIVTQAKGF